MTLREPQLTVETAERDELKDSEAKSMSTKLYTIRPWKWTREFSDYQQTYMSDSADGGYKVTRFRDDCEKHDRCQINSHGKWGPWRWEYCFAEYYDDDSTECTSPKEGKAAAWAHWLERLTPALIEQPSR